MADLAGANGQREEFYVVGKPNLPAKLSYSLATGKAKFGIDYVVDNMLHAKFLRSPYANAIGKWIDPPATPDRVLKALGKAYKNVSRSPFLVQRF